MKSIETILALTVTLPIFAIWVILFPIAYFRKKISLHDHIDIYFKYR